MPTQQKLVAKQTARDRKSGVSVFSWEYFLQSYKKKRNNVLFFELRGKKRRINFIDKYRNLPKNIDKT